MATPQTAGTREALVFDGEFLKKLEVLNVIAKKIFAGLLRAERRSPKKGVSAEFADHRAYVPGDDLRHLDWHLFGRLEELFLKLYKEEENLHLTVLVDTSPSMERPGGAGRPGKLDYALQVTAALAYIGMSNMDACNVVPFGTRLEGGLWGMKGRGKVFTLFDHLRTLTASGATDMAGSFKEFIGRERRRGVVIVLSDFYDLDGFGQALKFLRYPKNDVFVIHVVDPDEERPDLRGDLRLVDSERGGQREINVTDGMLQRYVKAFEELAGRVEAFCIRSEMGYVRARTGVPFDDLVLRILRRGGLVG